MSPQVDPPSRERDISSDPVRMTCGFSGSTMIGFVYQVQQAGGVVNWTQVWPPLVVLKTPRVSPTEPPTALAMVAYSVFGLDGSSAKPMRPIGAEEKNPVPFPRTLVQVRPASSDLNTPLDGSP